MNEGPTLGERARARRYAQPVLRFGGQAVSPEARALVAHCLSELVLPSLPSQQKRPSSLPAIERATEGTLAGLIAAQAQGDGWARRPMSATSFTADSGVSRGQFLKVCQALEVAGLIERAAGSYDRSGPVPRGVETRFRLSDSGRDLVASYGALNGWA